MDIRGQVWHSGQYRWYYGATPWPAQCANQEIRFDNRKDNKIQGSSGNLARIDSPWGLQESQKILAVPRFLIRWLLQKQRRDWHEVSNKRLVIAWTRSRAVAVPYTVTNNIPMRPSPESSPWWLSAGRHVKRGWWVRTVRRSESYDRRPAERAGDDQVPKNPRAKLDVPKWNKSTAGLHIRKPGQYERLFSDMAWSTTETLALSGTQLPYLVSNSHWSCWVTTGVQQWVFRRHHDLPCVRNTVDGKTEGNSIERKANTTDSLEKMGQRSKTFWFDRDAITEAW